MSSFLLLLDQLWGWTVLLGFVFVPYLLGLLATYQLPPRPAKFLSTTTFVICLGSLLWVLFAKQLGSQATLLWFQTVFLFIEALFFLCGAVSGLILKASNRGKTQSAR